jgi:N-acetylglucosamine-6-phosphate deacetylase
VAAERFGMYHKKGTGRYWDIPEEAKDKEVLEEALRPPGGKQAYLAMLNKDTHVSVIHSLCRLKTELRPKNPVKGKVAAFVNEVRPGGNTPNLVVFDKEAKIFASDLYPKVRFGKVAQYRAQQDLTRCPGLHIEGPFINKEKAGAQNPEFVRLPDWQELRALHAIAPAAIVSLAPEMPGAVELIRAATAAGIVCSAAHTSATYAQLSAGVDAGLKHLTHFGNAMTPLHHREIGCVGGGLYDDRVMLELICDTIHLCPDMLKMIFRVVPIDRILMITDSVAASWIGNGEMSLGGLAVVIKDHVARLKDGGALAGSALLANEGLRNVAQVTGLPLEAFIQSTSWNQARSLGLTGFGKIEAGYHADITLLREDFSVARTMVAGESRYVG